MTIDTSKLWRLAENLLIGAQHFRLCLWHPAILLTIRRMTRRWSSYLLVQRGDGVVAKNFLLDVRSSLGSVANIIHLLILSVFNCWKTFKFFRGRIDRFNLFELGRTSSLLWAEKLFLHIVAYLLVYSDLSCFQVWNRSRLILVIQASFCIQTFFRHPWATWFSLLIALCFNIPHV